MIMFILAYIRLRILYNKIVTNRVMGLSINLGYSIAAHMRENHLSVDDVSMFTDIPPQRVRAIIFE